MAEVRWSVAGRQDLEALASEFSRTSAAYAAAKTTRITDAVDRLEDFSRLGRKVPEYDDEGIRELIVGNYRVVYLLEGELVAIVGIVHGSRNLLSRLGPSPWDLG